MNWFDVFILIVVIVAFISGYINGIIKQLASITAIVFGILFSGQLAAIIMPYLQKIIGNDVYWGKPLSYVIAFLATTVTIMLIGNAIQKLVETIKLSTLNRITGAFFSVAKYLVIVSIALSVMQAFDLQEKIIDENIRKNSYFYRYINKISAHFVTFLYQDNTLKG